MGSAKEDAGMQRLARCCGLQKLVEWESRLSTTASVRCAAQEGGKEEEKEGDVCVIVKQTKMRIAEVKLQSQRVLEGRKRVPYYCAPTSEMAQEQEAQAPVSRQGSRGRREGGTCTIAEPRPGRSGPTSPGAW